MRRLESKRIAQPREVGRTLGVTRQPTPPGRGNAFRLVDPARHAQCVQPQVEPRGIANRFPRLACEVAGCEAVFPVSKSLDREMPAIAEPLPPLLDQALDRALRIDRVPQLQDHECLEVGLGDDGVKARDPLAHRGLRASPDVDEHTLILEESESPLTHCGRPRVANESTLLEAPPGQLGAHPIAVEPPRDRR